MHVQISDVALLYYFWIFLQLKFLTSSLHKTEPLLTGSLVISLNPYYHRGGKMKEGRVEGVGWVGRRRKILNGNFIILHICKLKIRVEVQLLIRSRTGSMGCFPFSIFFLSFYTLSLYLFCWKELNLFSGKGIFLVSLCLHKPLSCYWIIYYIPKTNEKDHRQFIAIYIKFSPFSCIKLGSSVIYWSWSISRMEEQTKSDIKKRFISTNMSHTREKK